MTEKNLENLKKFISSETNNDERPSEEEIDECIVNLSEEIGFNPNDSSLKRIKEVILPLFDDLYKLGRGDAFQDAYNLGYRMALMN